MSLLIAMRPRAANLAGAQDVKEYVLQRAAEFTMVPAAAMKAMEIGRNPACSVKEYASAIESDVRLAADILSMANSSLYASGAPAATLHDAVRRLGLRRCQGLILSTCTAGLMRSLPFDQTRRREALWQHGYMTAVMCRHLNESLRLGFTGEEFTAGLMHDLGRSLIAATVPERCDELDADRLEPAPVRLQHERALLGTDHCEIGAAFGVRNGLPAALVAAIQHHHAPEDGGEHQKLVALIATANQFAHQLEDGQLTAAAELTGLPSISFLAEAARVRQVLTGVTPAFASQAFDEARRLIA
jgi:HD-like signal output (HDOD) protein